MDDAEATSLEQKRTLVWHQYASLSRLEKGLVRRYVARMTGRSRAQVARLIGRYAANGRVTVTAYQRRKFAACYTKADVELLAYVDHSHGNLSGPATRHILQREFAEYGQAAFERIAQISVAQIYRFRNSAVYRKRNTSYQPTRPTPIPIGERRSRGRRVVQGFCGSTPYIRATATGSRVCITSTLSTK